MAEKSLHSSKTLAQAAFLQADQQAKREQKRRRALNLPLVLGMLFVFFILLLAVFGPQLAPRDPMEENILIRIGKKWDTPPFDFFTPGFPLGSDLFGRDLFSRLLWGVRPTMVMVFSVAVLRLFVGTLIGLFAGWFRSAFGRSLDTLIDTMISIPVLLVSLGAIAIVGVEFGIWAFILGLSISGWVETAQQVREQTRIIKSQVYVEAAHALGASNRQVLLGHVLRQITPMLGMLFAFEVSSTLMTTAGLGFLGYYIGGDVWVEVGDYVSRRISGMPELGQMLATSWSTLTEPWAMVAVGTTIFITVLGFNLIGEGLRENLKLSVHRRGLFSTLTEKAGLWMEDRIAYPVANLLQRPAIRWPLTTALAALVISAAGWQLSKIDFQQALANLPRPSGSEAAAANGATPQPGETSTESGQGAQPVDATEQAPTITPKIVWEFSDESGFTGGPYLDAGQGLLYSLSKGGTLYAMDLDGKVQWELALEAGGAGQPVVDEDGVIYVNDNKAALTAVSPSGEILWRFQSQAGSRAISSPLLSSSRVYFVVTNGGKGTLEAVGKDGVGLWTTTVNTPGFYDQPVLSSDEELIFFKDELLDANTGELLQLEMDEEFRILRFFPGQDGKYYLLVGNTVLQWERQGSRIVITETFAWNTENRDVIAPEAVGVSADSAAWLFYTFPGGNTEIIWLSLEDEQLGNASLEVSGATIAGFGEQRTVYACGGEPFDDVAAECGAIQPGLHEPLWTLNLGDIGRVQGGVYQDSTLYITTLKGKILAIREETQTPANPTGSGNTEGSQGAVHWTYDIGSDVRMGPFLDASGAIYVVTNENILLAVDKNGLELYRFPLPTDFYNNDNGSSYGYFWPHVFSDGTVLVVSDQHTVYAIDNKGKIAWEEPFEGTPGDWPSAGIDDRLYLTDKEASLYAFGPRGLLWKFTSTAAPYTARGATQRADGTLYYVPTTLGKGFIQAVSPDGEGLWVTEAATDFFYEGVEMTTDEKYLFLKADIFEAKTGQLIPYEVPFRVDDFFSGYDGNYYLRAGHTVMQWQIGEQGFEIVTIAAWDSSSMGRALPFYASVDRNSIIWLYYGEGLFWMDLTGRMLGRQPRMGMENHWEVVNPDQGFIRRCDRDPKTDTLTCTALRPGESEPFWQAVAENVPPLVSNEVAELNGFFFVVDEGVLYKFWVGVPPAE